MGLTGLLLVIAVPVCIWSWHKMARWFPPSLLSALMADVSQIMAESGLAESRSEGRPSAEPRPPFWKIEPRTPYWKKLAVGLPVLGGALGFAFWLYHPRPPKLEEGLAAARVGNYPVAKEILMPFAKKGNVQAREQLAQLETEAEKREDYVLLHYLAGLGCAPAQYWTGRYPEGDPKSVYWMKKASDQGYMYAQSKLADWYASGLVAGANPKDAENLYLLAARKGDQYSQRALSHLAAENRDYFHAYYWANICENDPGNPDWLTAACADEADHWKKRLTAKGRNAAEREIAGFRKIEAAESGSLCATSAEVTCGPD
jgi:TPR repeat protein